MTFPRTEVADISLPRILIGTNWLMGWSHRTSSSDNLIKERYPDGESMFPMFDAYMRYGIDAVMGPLTDHPKLAEGIDIAEQKLCKRIIRIDTPFLNMEDSPGARKESELKIRESAGNGSVFCLIHHACSEQLVNKCAKTLDRIDDYTKMIRDNGMIPGLSAHMPEIVLYSDMNGYDVETYIQIFNCMGFMMQVEIESVADIINGARKPVMVIKPFAAGRVTPYVGLTFNWNAIRERDMITIGATSVDEVHEDVEISFAALEHRFPVIAGRGSPVLQDIVRQNRE